jgi:hypothetical protein
MLIVKVPTALAAILFISSVSAQAMQFADRPSLISEVVNSSTATRALPSDDRSRRQINNRTVLLSVPVTGTELADRPSPISNRIRFEYGPGMASSWLNPMAPRAAITFELRPGPISNRFKASADGSIKAGDFTSSMTKTTVPSGIRPGHAIAHFCIGSMAPCGSPSFAERFTIGVRSEAYHHEQL